MLVFGYWVYIFGRLDHGLCVWGCVCIGDLRSVRPLHIYFQCSGAMYRQDHLLQGMMAMCEIFSTIGCKWALITFL